MAILIRPAALAVRGAELEQGWGVAHEADEVFAALRRVGRFSVVHLDFVDGHFAAPPVDRDAGPDWFEVAIGNLLVYARPLWERDDYRRALEARWRPYYDEALRRERLDGSRQSCHHHLDHILPYVERGLYFQAFSRLQIAFVRFLEALFIARRTYPIAYNKWIREQVDEILGLPDRCSWVMPGCAILHRRA